MRDLLNWSLFLGRYRGVGLRLHAFFPALAVLALMQDLRGDFFWYWLTTLGVLLVGSLLHELGHLYAAHRLSLPVGEIVLWPLGGLTVPGRTDNPATEFVVALSGPIANLAACLMCGAILISFDASLVALSPLYPPWVEPFTWRSVLAVACWGNWLLAVVNTLPAFPFDGGRVVRVLLQSGATPEVANTRLRLVSRLTATGLWALAYFMRAEQRPFVWGTLCLLGLIAWFATRPYVPPEIDEAEEFELVAALGEPPEPRVNPLQRWLAQRKEQRRLRRQQMEMDEERRVDEILVRLHQAGADSLSAADRAILERVSARYRNRQGP